MVRIQSKLLFSSGVIGIISIFTPVIFHISPNFFYHFWLWGSTLFFGLNSNEIGTGYNTEAAYLIPGIFCLILILMSSILILITTLKSKKMQKLKVKYYTIGGIVMILSPILLTIAWQIIHVLALGYQTFWGGDIFWPNISIFLQFLAGALALLGSIKMRRG